MKSSVVLLSTLVALAAANSQDSGPSGYECMMVPIKKQSSSPKVSLFFASCLGRLQQALMVFLPVSPSLKIAKVPAKHKTIAKIPIKAKGAKQKAAAAALLAPSVSVVRGSGADARPWAQHQVDI